MADRPARALRLEVRNAVDPETAAALRAAFLAFDEDDAAAVAVLAGAGGCFCAGYDLKFLAAHGLPESYDPAGEPALGITRTLLSKPVIAAVDGYAVAGGLEQPKDKIIRQVEESVRRHGRTGFIDPTIIRERKVLAHAKA